MTGLSTEVETEVMLNKQEKAAIFNFEMNQELMYPNLLILSKPEIIRLTAVETRCPNGHKVKMIRQFSR